MLFALAAVSGAGKWIGFAVVVLALLIVAAATVRSISAPHARDLTRIGLLNRLDASQIRSVARIARRIDYAPGQTIVREGEKSVGFHVIREGTATVSVRDQQRSTLGPGDYFGEISALDGGPRSATVVAKTTVSTLEIPARKLRGLVEKDSSVGIALYSELARLIGQEGIAPTGRVSAEQLAALCGRLREAEVPDWSEPGPQQTDTPSA